LTLPKWIVRRASYRRAVRKDPGLDREVLEWLRSLARADEAGVAPGFVEQTGLPRRTVGNARLLVRVTFYESGEVRMVDLWDVERLNRE
jgi:hypothetical protein